MRVVWIGVGILSVAMIAVGGLLATSGRSAEEIVLRPGDPQLVALGREVYDANCASCHGVDLEGQPNWKRLGPDGKMPAPPHDETGHTWHHRDATLFKLTKFGLASMLGPDSTYESGMPAYEGILSDEEILGALSYIKSRWPEDVRERHDAMNERSGN